MRFASSSGTNRQNTFAAGYLNRMQCRQSLARMRALFSQLLQFTLSLIKLYERLPLQGDIAAKVINLIHPRQHFRKSWQSPSLAA